MRCGWALSKRRSLPFRVRGGLGGEVLDSCFPARNQLEQNMNIAFRRASETRGDWQ